MQDGNPDFEEVRRRSMMTGPLKICMASQKSPVIFVAYDILWLKGEPLTGKPLLERKKLLQKSVKEGAQLAISRYVEEYGIALYALAEQQGLEGIVAKRKDSLYFQDKRTKDWIKSKVMMDDDFVCCGFIRKSGGMNSIVLGQYREKDLIYKGHVTLGASGKDFRRISDYPKLRKPPFANPPPTGNEAAV